MRERLEELLEDVRLRSKNARRRGDDNMVWRWSLLGQAIVYVLALEDV